ncbi:MAG: hypothetical protein QOF14_2663 [Hyphomicrobiales bacterium]|jgi:hypothetical protein|nr:hypothetical protein [Hyphomicrobiales bacterium]
MSAGTDPMQSSASAFALVVVARRDQLAFRIGSAAAGAVVYQVLTGSRIAVV